MQILGELLRATHEELRRAETIRPRYSVPLVEQDVLTLLTASYERQVRLRSKNYIADAATKTNLRKMATWLTTPERKPMLLLYGGIGNGKTTMAKAVVSLLSTLQTKIGERIKQGSSGISEEEDNFLYALRSHIRVPRIYTAQDIASLASSDQEEYQRISRAGFLVIDDFGCEPIEVKNYGTSVTPVTDILYKRYDDLQPTIVTTNLTMQDIEEEYGQRVRDRFDEVFETIGYTGKSYRHN